MTNYENMWTMMEKYQFTIDNHLSPHVKCVICNHIIIDACQGPCACLYCKKCINNYLMGSQKICPGEHNYSNLVKLDGETNVLMDHKTNYQISNLEVECPMDSCKFRNILINMFNHLQNCDKVPLSCPYDDMGCDIKPTSNELLIEHLQTDIYAHNKLLVKWVKKMENNSQCQASMEKGISFENELDNVFEKISAVLSKKQVLIGGMYKELKEMKSQVSDITNITSSLKTEIDSNSKNITALKNSNKKKVQELKQVFHHEMKKWNEELENEKQNSKYRQNEIEEIQKKTKQMETGYRKSDFFKKCILEKIIKIASFRWSMENIKEIRNDGEEMIYSEYFFSINKDYKMRLWLYPNGTGEIIGNDISFQLLIWNNDSLTNQMAFPFKADVTITLKNAIKPLACQSITQLCLFDKPDVFIYSISEPFHFNYSHLNLARVFENDDVYIECTVLIYK